MFYNNSVLCGPSPHHIIIIIYQTGCMVLYIMYFVSMFQLKADVCCPWIMFKTIPPMIIIDKEKFSHIMIQGVI